MDIWSLTPQLTLTSIQKEKRSACQLASTFVIHLLFRFPFAYSNISYMDIFYDMILYMRKYRMRCACGSLKGIS